MPRVVSHEHIILFLRSRIRCPTILLNFPSFFACLMRDRSLYRNTRRQHCTILFNYFKRFLVSLFLSTVYDLFGYFFPRSRRNLFSLHRHFFYIIGKEYNKSYFAQSNDVTINKIYILYEFGILSTFDLITFITSYFMNERNLHRERIVECLLRILAIHSLYYFLFEIRCKSKIFDSIVRLTTVDCRSSLKQLNNRHFHGTWISSKKFDCQRSMKIQYTNHKSHWCFFRFIFECNKSTFPLPTFKIIEWIDCENDFLYNETSIDFFLKTKSNCDSSFGIFFFFRYFFKWIFVFIKRNNSVATSNLEETWDRLTKLNLWIISHPKIKYCLSMPFCIPKCCSNIC